MCARAVTAAPTMVLNRLRKVGRDRTGRRRMDKERSLPKSGGRSLSLEQRL